MAYKKDIRAWLKETGRTWEELDKIWEEVKEINAKCRLVDKVGKTWSDLNMSVIEELPELKEKTLKARAEREQAEERQKEQERKTAEYKAYFNEHFDEIMVERIDKNEEIEEEHLKRMVYNGENIRYGENRRWSRTVCTVVEMCGRHFMIKWEEGLTENQDDTFMEQPVEVYKKTGMVVSLVQSWVQVDKKSGIGDSENGLSKVECLGRFESWLDKNYTEGIDTFNGEGK